MNVYTIDYMMMRLNIWAERMEDDGNNFVFYIPKEYVKRTEKSREVLPLQRTGDE